MTSFVTHGLIFATYAMASAALGAIVRLGFAADLLTSAGIAAAALLASTQIHGAGARLLARAELESEFADLRRANIILSEELDDARRRMGELELSLEQEAANRRQERGAELRMLQGLVARVSAAVSAARTRQAERHSRPGAEEGDSSGEEGVAAPGDVAAATLETVRAAIEDNRIDIYLQPTVSLPQRKQRYFEAFTRLRDEHGVVLEPSAYMPAAQDAGLLPVLDNALLFRCVQIIRKLSLKERRLSVFCNISLSTLQDAAFFADFASYLAQNRDLRSVLVFEIGQDALAGCGPRESGRLGQLAELGFAFSLDKIATLNLDLVDLRAKSVRFVKITAGLLTTALRRAREEDDGQEAFAFTEANDIHAEDFKELLTRYGIDLIAEKIETEAEVVEVLDMQVDYGQGHLFGEPRPVVLSAGGAGLASTQTIGERMQAVARR